MNKITLNYLNEKDLEILLKFAEKIGIFPNDISEKPNAISTNSIKDKRTVINNLTKIKSFSTIENPVEWQREVRKDRKLF